MPSGVKVFPSVARLHALREGKNLYHYLEVSPKTFFHAFQCSNLSWRHRIINGDHLSPLGQHLGTTWENLNTTWHHLKWRALGNCIDNTLELGCHLGVTKVSLGCHLGVSWVSIGCQMGVNWVSIGCFLSDYF